MEEIITRRKPGRPKGSRNKRPVIAEGPRLVPPSSESLADFKYADPNTLVARQLSLIDWAQQALRNEIRSGMQEDGARIGDIDIARIDKLSSGLVKSITALKNVSDLADELTKRMTPADLLEAALRKIEGQDAATIRYAIRRLRAFLETIGPVTHMDKTQAGDVRISAAGAIASLED